MRLWFSNKLVSPSGIVGAVDKSAVIEFAHDVAVDNLLQFDLANARVATGESPPECLIASENFLKQFDVAIKVVVDLRRRKRRGVWTLSGFVSLIFSHSLSVC